MSNVKSIKILGYFLSEKNVIIQYVQCSAQIECYTTLGDRTKTGCLK